MLKDSKHLFNNNFNLCSKVCKKLFFCNLLCKFFERLKTTTLNIIFTIKQRLKKKTTNFIYIVGKSPIIIEP